MLLMVHTMTHNEIRTNKFKTNLKFLAVVYVIFLAVGYLSLFTDISLCFTYHVLGIPSPSCGMGRAYASLPDVRQAFVYHPLFVFVPFMPLLVFLSDRNRNIAAILFIVLFLSVWAVRMFFMFPDTPPMDFNEQSLLRRILHGRTF